MSREIFVKTLPPKRRRKRRKEIKPYETLNFFSFFRRKIQKLNTRDDTKEEGEEKLYLY